MRRQSGLDASGTLNHVMGRGIEGIKILAKEIVEGEGRFQIRVAIREQAEEGAPKVRRLLCQLAVGKMGYPVAEVARFLGVSTSAVVRAAHSQDLPEIRK